MPIKEFLEKWQDEFGKKGDKREILIIGKPSTNNANSSGYRKAVFIVVYKMDENKIPSYILLKRKKHWIGWEFPKGGVDKGENLIETAKRECFEETGHKPIKITKFNISGKYLYKKFLADRPSFTGQTFSLFSAQVAEGKTSFDKSEHSGFQWLSYQEAMKKLSWSNQKRCLRIVNSSLMRK